MQRLRSLKTPLFWSWTAYVAIELFLWTAFSSRPWIVIAALSAVEAWATMWLVLHSSGDARLLQITAWVVTIAFGALSLLITAFGLFNLSLVTVVE